MAKRGSRRLPKQPTRKQVSRNERDARRSRNLMLAVGGTLLLALIAVGIGLLNDTVLLPNQPVAIVGDTEILTREFQQRVRLERLNLVQQFNFLQSIGAQDNLGQIDAQLQNVQGIGSQVISQLVNEELFRQAASELGVEVSAAEVEASIEESLGFLRNSPTPAPTRTPAPTPTASDTVTTTATATRTPAPSATPLTEEGYRERYDAQLDSYSSIGYNEADFKRLTETQLLVEQIQEILASDVVTRADQVQFDYLFAPDEASITLAFDTIETEGFDSVYTSVLSETFSLTTVLALETPYVPYEILAEAPRFGTAFADLAFDTPISDTFGVISDTNSTAFYIVRVTGHEERFLDPALVDQKRSDAVQAWLNERREGANVEFFTWEDRVPSDPDIPGAARP